MEYVDLVNDQNIVVGSELKHVCHARGLKHRGAGLLVFRDETHQEILLQKRSALVRNAGRWCTPGGHVLTGESYLAAAERECLEELFSDTLEAPRLRFGHIFTFYKDEPEDREFIALYRLVHRGPFFPDPQEVADLEFFHLDDLERWITREPERFTKTLHDIFKYYRAFTSGLRR